MSAPPANRPMQGLFNAPYLLLTLTALLWAGNMVLGRYIAGHVPPVTLAAMRWIGATAIILPFAWGQIQRDLPLIRRSFWMLVLLAATGISSFNAMSYHGLQYTQAVNGLLLQSTAPLLVGLWSFLLFRDRLSPGQIAGILTSLSGVVVIISQGSMDTLLHLTPNIGDMWILVALMIYAFYTTMLRKRPQLGPLSFLATIMAIGAVLLTPIALYELLNGGKVHFDAPTILTLAYVMVAPSLLAYLFFNRAVELVGANRSAPFLHLMPVFGTALAIIFLGEELAWYHFAGYALVICGIFLATRSGGKPPTGTGAPLA